MLRQTLYRTDYSYFRFARDVFFFFSRQLRFRCEGKPLLLGIRLLRGGILNRTYGTHKTLYIYLYLLTLFGPIYYGPP